MIIIGQPRIILIRLLIAINYFIYNSTVVRPQQISIVFFFSIHFVIEWNFQQSVLSDCDVCTIYSTISYCSTGDKLANNVAMIGCDMRSFDRHRVDATHFARADSTVIPTAFILTHAQHLNFTNLIYRPIVFVSQTDVRTFLLFSNFLSYLFTSVFFPPLFRFQFYFDGDEQKKKTKRRENSHNFLGRVVWST